VTGVASLIKRELLLIIRNRRLIMSLIIAPAMIVFIMAIMGFSMSAAVSKAAKAPVLLAVYDLDGGSWAKRLVSYLRSKGASIVSIQASSLDEAVKLGFTRGCDALIVIPRGFTANISMGTPSLIRIYFYARGTSMTYTYKYTTIDSLIRGFESIIARSIASRLGVKPSFVERPYNVTTYTVLSGLRIYEVSPSLLQSIGFMAAYGPLIAIGIIASIAAIAFAEEKEEKTLELLLSQPVSRTSIVVAKLFGVIIVGVIATVSLLVAYMVSFNMMASMMSKTTPPPSSSSRVPLSGMVSLAMTILSPSSVGVIVGATAVSMILAAGLAMLLASLAEDIRTAQSLVGFLWPILFVVMFVIPFAGVPSPPAAYLIGFVPFAPPALIVQTILTGGVSLAVLSIIEQCVDVIIVLYVLARIISSEYVVTGYMQLFRKYRVRRL